LKVNRLTLLLVSAGLLLTIWLGLLLFRAQRGLITGTELVEQGLWGQARPALRRYLWLHPSDASARLLLAEALVRDDLLEPEGAVQEALDQLARVPDTAPNAATVRTKEGRLLLLILHQPDRAERALRRALACDPDNGEAAYLLWKLLELSGRFESSEPVFWVVHDQAPPEQKAERLRQWYMSQFFPLAVNPDLEREMGLLGDEESPTVATELRRYRRFQEAEPDRPLPYVCEAYWLQREGDPSAALDLLDETHKKLDTADSDPFFLMTLIAVLIDLGEYQRAEGALEKWPPPFEGYDYWKWRAIIEDEFRGNGSAALAAYDKALGVWPGPVDWRLRNRKAGCLRRLGDQQAAGQEQARAKKIETLMETEVHRRVRLALGQLDAPVMLETVIEFYDQLGREREAQAWSDVVRRLRESAALQKR
jgi:tetratricopeptide (TPR) repeat protein